MSPIKDSLLNKQQFNTLTTSQYSHEGGWGNFNHPLGSRQVQIIGEDSLEEENEYQNSTNKHGLANKKIKKNVKTLKNFSAENNGNGSSRIPKAYVTQIQLDNKQQSSNVVQKNNFL